MIRWLIKAQITRMTDRVSHEKGWVPRSESREYIVYASSPPRASRMVRDYLTSVGIPLPNGALEKQTVFSLSNPVRIGFERGGVVHFVKGWEAKLGADTRKAPGA